MSRSVHTFAAALTIACALTGCARVSTGPSSLQSVPARAASGTPARFEPVVDAGSGAAASANAASAAGAARSGPTSAAVNGACRSPLRDPERGLEIRFVRSMAGIGDYAVPEGSYGAAAGELLRVDCRTGKALGLVRR